MRVLWILMVVACGHEPTSPLPPPGPRPVDAGVSVVDGTPYAELFVRDRAWQLVARVTHDGQTTTANIACRVDAVRDVRDGVVARVACTGVPDDCSEASPAGVYFATAAGLWTGVDFDDPSTHFENPGEAEPIITRPPRAVTYPSFGSYYLHDTRAEHGGWCATWHIAANPSGNRSLCVAPGVGIASAIAHMDSAKAPTPSEWACMLAPA